MEIQFQFQMHHVEERGGHDERSGNVEVRPNHIPGETHHALRTAYLRRTLRDLPPEVFHARH